MKNEQTYFSDTSLCKSDFSKWLAKAAGPAKARYKLCKNDFNLAEMGIKLLESHAKSQKH